MSGILAAWHVSKLRFMMKMYVYCIYPDKVHVHVCHYDTQLRQQRPYYTMF